MTKLSYSALKARADRYADSLLRRARQECQAAGLGHDIGCALHNALVSLEYGKPWREVDYSHARKARWLLNRQWEASRVIDRLYQRLGPDAFDWR